MPHLTLDYTTNLGSSIDFASMFDQLHQVLSEIGKIEVTNCKSRAVPLDDYRIGRGGGNEAFVHLDLRLLESRSAEVKQRIGERILAILDEHYAASRQTLELQITVEIREMERASYFKLSP